MRVISNVTTNYDHAHEQGGSTRIRMYQMRYKWINRVNGVNGPIPERCSKCKRSNWNLGSPTHKEIGLRKRVRGLKTIYEYLSLAVFWEKMHWPAGLTEKFLNLDPPPTLEELEGVLFARDLVLKLNSQNQFNWRNYVPVPNNPGYMKYDPEKYKKLLLQDAQRQQELMQQVIFQSRLDKGHSTLPGLLI